MATVTVFGLGEAGSAIAVDLAASGQAVQGFDPAPVPTPVGVIRLDDPRRAVLDSDVVLALTGAADATTALGQALDDIPAGTLYADLSTGSPALKRALAATAAGAGLPFADVALMGTVPDKGIRTPALASGDGADAFVTRFSPLGMPVRSTGPDAGAAATRKLLRSTVVKGVAALLVESMQAARRAGVDAEIWDNLAEQFTAADAAFLHRMLEGTERHAARRHHEMEATVELLEELGIDAIMTRATTEVLRRVRSGEASGVGDLAPPGDRHRTAPAEAEPEEEETT